MASIKLTGDTSGVITVSAPASAGTNTLTLPATTGTILDTNSALASSKLTGALPAISGAALTGLPAGGKIAQVLSTTKTDTFSTTSFPTFVDCTGLTVTITPAAASSKIYVMLSISGGGMEGFRFQLVRDSTAIAIGTGSIGSRTAASGAGSNRNYDELENPCANFLDSPSTTSATTYKIQVSAGNTGTDSKINATRNDPDSSYGIRTASTITVMEVSA